MPTSGYDTAPAEVRAALQEASQRTGRSLDFLASVASRESSFNPMARATSSSAAGLGQFVDDTWKQITATAGAKYGITPETSRFDPRANALMLGEYANQNAQALRHTLGREATDGELYAAHFMGAGGFGQIARMANSSPNAQASTLFPKEAAANPSIFNGKTVAQVYASLTNGEKSSVAPPPGALPNIFEQYQEPEKPSFWGSMAKGYMEAAEQEQTQTIAFHFVKDMGDPALAPDANFKITPELVRQHTSDLPEKYAQWVADNAHSEAHMSYLADRARRDIAADEDLSEFGFIGNMGLRSAAILTDIPTWLMGAGAGKVAMFGRAGLAAKAASAGLIAVAENAPVTAMKMAYKPAYDLRDAAVDNTTALLFGAGFGAAFGHPGVELEGALHEEAKATHRAALIDQGHTLTPSGERHYAPSTLSAKGSPPKGTSTGAAAADDGVLKASFLDVAEPTPNARLARSHSVVRETAAGLDDRMSGDGGQTVRNGETAFEEARRTHDAADAGVSRVVNSEFAAEAAAQGIPLPMRVGPVRDRFEEAAAWEIISPNPEASPHVKASAAAYAQGFNGWLKRAKAAGAEWAQDIKDNANYFPMVFDREKVRRYVDQFGEEGVVSVVRQALKSAAPELEDAVASKVAEKYVRVVQTATEGLEASRANALAGLDKHGLGDLLREQGMDPEEVDAFLSVYRSTAKSGPKNFRQKTLLNDTARFTPEGHFKERIVGHDGSVASISKPATEEHAFSIRDLTNMNADEVWHSYNAGMAGNVAMVRQGYQTRGQFLSHITEITKGEANKRSGYTDAIAARDFADLDYLGKRIYGIPTRDMKSGFEKFNSLFGNLNFARVMGQSGVAQLGDMPKIMLKTGMAAAWKTFRIGDLANVLRRGGPEADVLARDLETITGVGTAGVRGDIVTVFKDMEHYYPDSTSATVLDRAIRGSKTLANITSVVSGMTPVNDFLQRWAVRASMQHLADVVRGVSTRSEKVLNDMGLGPDELARFKTLVDRMDIAPNGTVRDLRFAHNQGLDAEGMDMLGAYLSRQARTIIVETSPGNLPRWMGDSAFRFMGQFRAFSFASHSANTLHNIKMGYAYAAQSLLVTGAWAGLVYTAHTYSKSVGRADRDEYLAKNLDPLHLGAGALSRSSDTGILPSVIDTALFPVYRATGWESPFVNARSTGLAAGIQGTPLVALGVDATEALGQGAAVLGGRKEFTRTDAQRLARLMPLNNVYGIANALRAVTDQFPQSSN